VGNHKTISVSVRGSEDFHLIPKRVDEWDEYFSSLAQATSIKSKDPRCPVGAVIVSADNVVLTTGFNGLPRGMDDDPEIYENVDEKLKVVCHAEQNAIINAARLGISVKGASIYVTKFPCLACCNSIIQAGIKRIYTLDHRYWDDDPFDSKQETDHWRKRRALRQTHIVVDAPNHPEYAPEDPNSVSNVFARKPPQRETNPARRNGTRLSANSSDVSRARKRG
jgi:dCMP deaminase